MINVKARSWELIPIFNILFVFLDGNLAGIEGVNQFDVEEHIQQPVTALKNLFSTELCEDDELLNGLITFIWDDPCVQTT